MIDSILSRKVDRVNWEKICTLDKVVVEEREIKRAAKQYYQLWTRKNPSNMDYWEEWSSFYEEREDIPMGVYDDLMKNIESVELDQIIA
ncbi:17265_t:CDS:1, partial [Gigaspora rosea]